MAVSWHIYVDTTEAAGHQELPAGLDWERGYLVVRYDDSNDTCQWSGFIVMKSTITSSSSYSNLRFIARIRDIATSGADIIAGNTQDDPTYATSISFSGAQYRLFGLVQPPSSGVATRNFTAISTASNMVLTNDADLERARIKGSGDNWHSGARQVISASISRVAMNNIRASYETYG